MSSVDALTGQLGRMTLCGLVCTQSKKPVPLKSIDVNVTVKGFVADVTSDLTYINTQKEAIGADFIFPLDEQSSVYHFQANIDGRIITAECQDKDQARQTFKDATQQGHTAFLLEETGDTGDVFQCKVGNLPPEKPVTVSLRYVIELSTQEDGSIRFLLPTILNPRYNPSISDGGATNVPNVAFAASGDIPYQLNFKGAVTSSCGIREVKSDNNSLTWTPAFNDNTTGHLSLASTYKFDHDLAFNVFYNDFNKPFVVVEKGDPTKEGILRQDVIMLNFVPDLAEQKGNPISNEYIFVIDRSGSMQGPRIESAKETLLFFLKSLPVGCLFNIISFGSRFEDLFQGGSQPYNEDTLKQAMALQQSMTANFGGTELLKPLEHMYAQPLKAGYFRQVFLLTDGQVWNTREVTSLVEQHSNSTRVFSFGIGTGASTALVKGIARAGKGIAEFVIGKDRLQAKVMNTMKLASQPALCDVKMQYDVPVTPFPSRAPPLYSGHRLIIYGLVDQTMMSQNDLELKLTGKLGNSDVFHEVKFAVAAEGGDNYGGKQPLHRLCAKAQIKQLEEDEEVNRSQSRGLRGQNQDQPESQKDTIVLLSTTTNVISRYTSFVGVDKETKQALSDQAIRNIPYIPVPAQCFAMAQPMYCNAASGGKREVLKSFSHGLDSDVLSSFQMPCGAQSSGTYYDDSCPMPSQQAAPRGRPQAPPPPKGRSQAPPPLRGRLEASPPEWGIPMAPPPQQNQTEQRQEPPPPPTGLSGLVTLQTFQGSWILTEQFAQLIGVSAQVVESSSPVKNLEVWATALALAWLQENFAQQKDEWEMLAQKASEWLQRQDLNGISEETIKVKATDLLNAN